MRYKNATLIFLFLFPGSVGLAYARGDICGIVYLDDRLMSADILNLTKSSEECVEFTKKNKGHHLIDAEVNFRSLSKDVPKHIHLTKSYTVAPGSLPSFIRYDVSRRKPRLDRNKLTEAFDSWPVYQTKAGQMLEKGGGIATTVSFSQRSGPDGECVIAELFYTNVLTGEKWQEGYYSFFKPGIISVFYDSTVLFSEDSQDKEFMQKMKMLFMSMRTVPSHARSR